MDAGNIIVSLKGLGRAKSRLRAEGLDSHSYAVAFAWDTLAAARSAARVGRLLVVTVDPLLRLVL